LGGRLVRCARLVEGDRNEALSILRRQLDPLRQRLQLHPGPQFAHLAQLVLIARGEDPPPVPATRSCTWRSLEMPISARPSNSSSEARESGVRSPVACTSTRPPSPVITTLASTSALESSP